MNLLHMSETIKHRLYFETLGDANCRPHLPHSGNFYLWTTSLLLTFSLVSVVSAGPWNSLNPFKVKVEADPTKSYELTQEHGPWLVLATTFAGPEAETEAQQLVLELRRDFGLVAFLHKKRFDYSRPVVGIGLFGGPKKMRHRQKVAFDEWAVLVGQFESVEDPNLERTLKKIKYMRPTCLGVTKSQRFRGIRDLQKRLNGDLAKREKGPMGNAFVTRNPLLPQEMFTPAGIDKFVYELNKGVEFSLLDCKGKYTVRVATFRGNIVINPRQVNEINNGKKMNSRLANAAKNAQRLTTILRKKGVDAYQFHDRNESIVTVGHFSVIGSPTSNGQIQFSEAIYRTMQQYSPDTSQVSRAGLAGLKPKTFEGIAFDLQPYPIEVPQYSVSKDYADAGWFR